MKTPKKSRSSSVLHESTRARKRTSSSQSCYACGAPSRRSSAEPAKKNCERPPWRPPSRQSTGPILNQSSSSIVARPSTAASTSRRGSVAIKTFEEMKASSSTFVSTMKNRQNGIQRLKATMKSRGNTEDEVIVAAISLPDKSAFVHLLQQLISKPISLKLTARILPEIRFLLSHKNSSFVNTTLQTLDHIVTLLKESIKNGLSLDAKSLDDADAATKQRNLLAIKCKESLTEIYINAHFITGKLDDEQSVFFNSIIDKFIDLVA